MCANKISDHRQQYYCENSHFEAIIDDEVYLCTLPPLLSICNLKVLIYQKMYSE